MYNVALNIKAPSTRIWIFLKLNIFFITKWPSVNIKPVNPLSHPWPIHVKKYVVSKIIWIRVDWSHKLVPEGLGNCSFDLLAEVCCDISLTKRDLLPSRNLLEITATYNLTRSAYQDKCSFNT